MPNSLSDLDRERLSAFRSTMTRCQWLLLTTTLIACFMLLHLFTGEFGFQTQQVKRTLYKRLAASPTEFLVDGGAPGDRPVLILGPGNRLKADLHAYLIARDSLRTEEAKNRAATKLVEDTYSRIVGNRLIRDLQVREGTVPVIGVSTPGNDYIAIMTWMLLIFSTALWLSIRSLEAILRKMPWEGPTRDIAKLYVTFTGLLDGTPGAKVARVLQHAAAWFPAVLFGLVAILDVVPSLLASFEDPDHVVMGEPFYIALRIALLAVGGMWLVGIAVSNSGRIARIDDWLYADERRGIPARRGDPPPA